MMKILRRVSLAHPLTSQKLTTRATLSPTRPLTIRLTRRIGRRFAAGRAVKRRINDTPSEEDEEQRFNVSEIALYAGVPERWDPGLLWQLKYIDDGLKGERLCDVNAVCHITCRKQVKYLHAKRTE